MIFRTSGNAIGGAGNEILGTGIATNPMPKPTRPERRASDLAHASFGRSADRPPHFGRAGRDHRRSSVGGNARQTGRDPSTDRCRAQGR